MIRFGYLYLNGALTIYDVSVESVHGRSMYVASLSSDPRIAFRAVRAEHAVEQLKMHLTELAHAAHVAERRAAVTWLPDNPTVPHAS
jgi:hypothetical protein